jgi:uncharacterized membrane protein
MYDARSMSKPNSKQKKSKRPFLRGLAVLLPSVLTLWLIVKAYQFIDSAIAEPINRGIRASFIQLPNYVPSIRETFAMGPTLEELNEAAEKAGIAVSNTSALQELSQEMFATSVNTWWTEHPWMNFLGLIVAAVIVYISGRLVGGFIGRAMYRRIEKIMVAVPVIRKVYPYVKQLVDFLISDEDKPKFSRVVAVEYPRKGIWSVGFMTGESLKVIEKKIPDSVTIFIPSSPTPFTGYTITVPRIDTIDLPITVEEAIRFAVSGGVLVPDHQNMVGLEPAKMETEDTPEQNKE